MPGSRLNVHLYRDSFNTPWGFRLQGGKDLNQPLTVQRVFSNSPAEGELQRGDIILSINGRDSAQLTHKQAQDSIKHGGGQVQLVVNRPPPGTHVGPLSPPIVTQRPRAPSLQSPSSHNPPPRPINISMAQSDYDPSFIPSNPGDIYSYQSQPTYNKPPHQPLHVQAIPSPQNTQNYQRQRSSNSQPPSTPTPTTPIPPWAAQQFAPKRVSKLSKLGGGGPNFGTQFSTLPRGSSGAHYGVRGPTHSASSDLYDGPQETEPDRLATGPIPKVCSLRNLGGGGYDFGSSFGSGAATLPRRAGRRLSQPASMPSSGVYKPSKVNLSRLGGGGPEFGSDYSHVQRGYGQTPAQRVHTSLDTITLSPRSQEAPAASPFYQTYEAVPYQQPQQVYTPTGLLLEQQRLQEQEQEGEAIVPVWERRKHFQKGPGQSSTVRTPVSKPPPKIPKPQPGPTTYGNFGTDYSKAPPQRQTSATWRPTPQFKPTPAPVSAPPATYSPAAVTYVPKPGPPPTAPKPSPPAPSQGPVHATPPVWQPSREEELEGGTPAWRSTLKATGVKPWEMDTNYSIEQQPVRSVPYNPTPPKSPISAGPFSPTQTGAIEMGGGSENGPKVVHLQYNSPMYLYSNKNVEETLKGQTQALAGHSKQPPAPATNESGERDWSQSAVLRFINQEDKRKSNKPAPPVAPKPHALPHYSPVSPPQPMMNQPFFEGEIGASDF